MPTKSTTQVFKDCDIYNFDDDQIAKVCSDTLYEGHTVVLLSAYIYYAYLIRNITGADMNHSEFTEFTPEFSDKVQQFIQDEVSKGKIKLTVIDENDFKGSIIELPCRSISIFHNHELGHVMDDHLFMGYCRNIMDQVYILTRKSPKYVLNGMVTISVHDFIRCVQKVMCAHFGASFLESLSVAAVVVIKQVLIAQAKAGVICQITDAGARMEEGIFEDTNTRFAFQHVVDRGAVVDESNSIIESVLNTPASVVVFENYGLTLTDSDMEDLFDEILNIIINNVPRIVGAQYSIPLQSYCACLGDIITTTHEIHGNITMTKEAIAYVTNFIVRKVAESDDLKLVIDPHTGVPKLVLTIEHPNPHKLVTNIDNVPTSTSIGMFITVPNSESIEVLIGEQPDVYLPACDISATIYNALSGTVMSNANTYEFTFQEALDATRVYLTSLFAEDDIKFGKLSWYAIASVHSSLEEAAFMGEIVKVSDKEDTYMVVTSYKL